jgi:hypothetical protein
MILIPDLETILLLVPRTGSGSLKRAVLAKYPNAMLLYRHMEADGVPQGYDRWQKIGVLRNPLDRLWSLFKFLQNFDGPYHPEYAERQRYSVTGLTFSDWLQQNQTVFSDPYSSAGGLESHPGFSVRHPIPETRKSQFYYLRPDLGTAIYHFNELPMLAARLGVTLPHENRSYGYCGGNTKPYMTPEAEEHMQRFFEWDFQQDAAFQLKQIPCEK